MKHKKPKLSPSISKAGDDCIADPCHLSLASRCELWGNCRVGSSLANLEVARSWCTMVEVCGHRAGVRPVRLDHCSSVPTSAFLETASALRPEKIRLTASLNFRLEAQPCGVKKDRATPENPDHVQQCFLDTVTCLPEAVFIKQTQSSSMVADQQSKCVSAWNLSCGFPLVARAWASEKICWPMLP